MLEKIHIKNYAIIEQLEITFPNGMIAVTGETGAGKSIIIGAIQSALGGKIDSKSFKNNAEKCILEIQFSLETNAQKQLQSIIELDDYSEIIIRREITTSGKSRSFVNDSQYSIQEIQQVAAALISIHQQFDHLEILEQEYQINVLDTYCEHLEERNNFEQLYQEYKKKISECKKIEEENKKLLLEREYLEFQFQELDKANLTLGELSNSEQLLKVASNAEDIKTKTQCSLQLLQGEQGIQDAIYQIQNHLKSIRISDELQEVYERIGVLHTEIKDISYQVEKIHDNIDFDPKKIQNLQSRIDLYNRLLKKHQVTSDEELIEIQAAIETKLLNITQSDETILAIQNEIKGIENNLEIKAEKLRKTRLKQIASLKKYIESLLRDLGMENAIFEIELIPLDSFKKSGKDEIKFLFTANKGSQAKALQNHASGGELSRVNLAIKSILAEKAKLPTMIFDEIDTGVSGQVALQMGNLLRQCSKNQQLIAITHSPQVASRANHHLYVFKKVEKSVTNTHVKFLNLEEKHVELAKMLSSDPPTTAALQNAKELLSLQLN